MRADLTKASITAYAGALAGEGCLDNSARLKELLPIFWSFSSKPIDNLFDKIDQADPSMFYVSSDDAASVASILPSLRNLEKIVEKTATKKRLNDLVAFRKRLESHESASLRQLIAAVRPSTVTHNEWAEKLEAALGDNGQFNPLFDQLGRLGAVDVLAVADILMRGGAARSKKATLGKIHQRHVSLRTFIRKRKAMEGRSAA